MGDGWDSSSEVLTSVQPLCNSNTCVTAPVVTFFVSHNTPFLAWHLPLARAAGPAERRKRGLAPQGTVTIAPLGTLRRGGAA
jgi:hypothetical protein